MGFVRESMTRIFFFFYILTASLGFARAALCPEISPEEILISLRLHGFQCTPINLTGCAYQQCTGKMSHYPQPVLITIPQTVTSLRLHFHGHLLGLASTRAYEGTLPEMIQAFGLQKSLCTSSEVTIFPKSLGANTTYKDFFKDSQAYTQFFTAIQSTLGNHLKDSPLHLSGHSGGGKYVAGALNAGIKTSKVSIFDGIYSSATKDTLKQWYTKDSGQLTIATVKGTDPEKFATQLKNDLGGKFISTKNSIGKTSYDVHTSGNLIHYSRGAGAMAHFETVTEIWPGTN
jgi:hypothetical protein